MKHEPLEQPVPKGERVLVADDDTLTRDLLMIYFKTGQDMTAESCGTLAELEDLIETTGKFDVVLLDYQMPGIASMSGVARVVKLNHPYPVVLVSGRVNRETVYEAIEAGARGFFPKSMSREGFLSALRLVLSGEVFLPADFYQMNGLSVPATRDDLFLTQKERQVLARLCKAMSNKEIADDLQILPSTARVHVSSIMTKLNAKNRTHAVLKALEKALV